MFKLRTLGLVLASLVTGIAISGAVTLIALDFAGTDGLARAWSAVSGWTGRGSTIPQPVRSWRVG